jgi:hypothetical protein
LAGSLPPTTQDQLCSFRERSFWNSYRVPTGTRSQGRFGRSLHRTSRKTGIARPEIDNTAKILQCYEALIDDPNSDEFERISEKYTAAVAKSKRLLEDRTTLETQIASQNSGSRLLLERKGIDIFPVGRTSKEDRLELRLYLKMLDRWNANDIEGYLEVYWKSPELLVVVDSEQFNGWQQLHDSYINGQHDEPSKV